MTVHAFPSDDRLVIRPFTSDDAGPTLRLFRDAVRMGTRHFYSEAERRAWAPTIMSGDAWRAARLHQLTLVAEVAGEVLGFSDLQADGKISMLFVDPTATRKGIATALLGEVERQARDQDQPRLYAFASLVAEPLFKRAGFVFIRRQWAAIGTERLTQVLMKKTLEPI